MDKRDESVNTIIPAQQSYGDVSKRTNPACNIDDNIQDKPATEIKLKKDKEGDICGWEDCQELCDMKCGACQKVTYCCAEHQKKHWKEHRKECCPYIIKENEDFGYYLVAARDLKANVEIIRENPAVYAPVHRDVIREERPAKDISFCLTCCTYIKSENSMCSKCNWPICGMACENNPCHSEYECEYLSKSKTSYSEAIAEKKAFDVYKSIFALRCLLFREKCPSVWRKVEKTYIAKGDEADSSNGSETTEPSDDIFMELITSYGAENLLKTPDDLIRVLEFICFLSVEVPHDTGQSVRSGVFIYEKLLMLGNNNCYPNASWGITHPPSFEIVIRSAVPIKKGTRITIPLNNELDLCATYLRQVHRFKGRRKPCKCERCSDPTELQTNLSSVKCFQCKKGYYTPITPLVIKSDWQCCYCEDIVECDKIFDVVKSAERVIHEALNEYNIEELESIYNRLMRSTFHPNHFIIVNLSYHILQFHMQDIFVLNEFGLERVIAHCRNILAVADVVLPGLSMMRATILTFQAKAMCLQIRNLSTSGSSPSSRNKGLLKNQLVKLRQYLSEALEYFKTDPNTTLPTGENSFVEELEIIKNQLFQTDNELESRKV